MTVAARFVLVAGLASILPLAARAGDASPEVVAVLDPRSNLEGDDGKLADPGQLGERVRAAARVALSEARVLAREETLFGLLQVEPEEDCAAGCDVQAGRDLHADLVVSADLVRTADGYRMGLELHETESGALLARASATGGAANMADAVSKAAAQLFRPVRPEAAKALAIGPARLPEPPGAVAALPDDDELDDNVVDALAEAQAADAKGSTAPGAAGAAWDKVASVADAPVREIAVERAGRWRAYADEKRTYDSQLAKDTAQVRKVLPRSWIDQDLKIELLLRFANVYGVDQASALSSSVRPVPARHRAELVLGCEAKDAPKCTALARIDDAAGRARPAVEWLDKACHAGSIDACEEAGERWLKPPTRDASRAVAALERACEGARAAACARLSCLDDPPKKEAPAVAAAPALPPAATEVKRESPDRSKPLGLFLVTAGAIAAGAGAFLAVEDATAERQGRFDRRSLHGPEATPRSRTTAAYLLGGAGVVSAVVGIVLLAKPAPAEDPNVRLDVGPGGIGISGKLP